MTLTEIEALETEVLTCDQVASVLHRNPQTIRVTARQRPELLPFPVIVTGSRVSIPRQAFLRAMRGEVVGA